MNIHFRVCEDEEFDSDRVLYRSADNVSVVYKKGVVEVKLISNLLEKLINKNLDDAIHFVIVNLPETVENFMSCDVTAQKMTILGGYVMVVRFLVVSDVTEPINAFDAGFVRNAAELIFTGLK